MKSRRLISTLLAASLLASSVAGCSSSETTSSTPSSSGGESSASSSETSTTEKVEVTYPIEGAPTFSMWMDLHNNIAPYAKNYGETEWAKEMEKRTGVHIEYEHPASGQADESLQVLLASGDYPDIICYLMTKYVGGAAKLYQDNVIYKLNDYMEYAPDLFAYLEANPEVDRQVKGDDGSYYLFPMIMENDSLLAMTMGPTIRKDYLDKVGMELPETISDWETMLTAFKEELGVEIPFVAQGMDTLNRTFCRAYDVSYTFYPENKVIKYGPIEEGYREYLTTMADWYSKGLIDRNFSTNDKQALNSAMTTGAGSTVCAGGGQFGPYLQTAQAANPEYDLVGAVYPTLEKGQKVKYNGPYEYRGDGNCVITTACENVEAAVQYLNYGYTEEGHMFYNFGTEGVSYELIDGEPVYTDTVLHSPDGKTVAQAMSNYCRGNTSGPFVQDERYLLQYYSTQQQKDAVEKWAVHDEENRLTPPVVLTPEESSEYSSLMADINTYVDEMSLKFVMGQESLDKFDEYVESIKSMGIEDAIAIQQAALDRYYAR